MFFRDWIDIVLGKGQARLASITLSEGSKNLAIASLVVGFLNGVEYFLALPFQPEAVAGFWVGLGLGIIPAIMVLLLIMFLISILIYGGLANFLSKLFGGQGQSGNYIGALALIGASFLGTIYVILTIIDIVAALFGSEAYSIATLIALAIDILASLWALVLIIRATKDIHKLSTSKAVLAVLGVIIIPFALIMILAVIVGVLVFILAPIA